MKSLFRLTRSFSVISKMKLSNDRITHPKYCITNYALNNYCTKQNEIPEADTSSHSSSSTSSEEEDETEEEKLQFKILGASLPFVKEYGWTADTIAKGAECLGYSSMVHGMFQNGGTDLVNFHYMKCNTELEILLKELVDKNKTEKRDLSTREFLRHAVETRLRMNADYINNWDKAMVLHASPSNIPVAFENLTNLVNTIWYYAGDKSVDSAWYGRRGSLLVVYKCTEMCMLQDKSQDFQVSFTFQFPGALKLFSVQLRSLKRLIELPLYIEATWSFLSRRLNEISTVDEVISQFGQRIDDACSIANIGFLTVQNILGLNSKSR